MAWFMREWMDARGITQAEMIELTGWSKASMSQIYNKQQDLNPRLLKEGAEALGLEPFELLMAPDRASALREQLDAAERVVQTNPVRLMGQHPAVDPRAETKRLRKTR